MELITIQRGEFDSLLNGISEIKQMVSKFVPKDENVQFTKQQFMEYIGLRSDAKFSQIIKSGKLKYSRMGREYRIFKNNADEFIKNNPTFEV